MRLDKILDKIRRSPTIRVTRPITQNRKFLQKLEMRLDYILYRLRFATTVPTARHLCNHHRILVNGSVANKASFICKPSDIISVKEDPRSVAMVHNYFDSPMFERATPPDAASFKYKEYQCFVSGLAPVVDDEALARAFMPCGDFIKAEVVKDPKTGKSKGFGFVTYGSKKSMKEAVRVMSRNYFNGGNLAVKEAASREKMDKKKGEGKVGKDGEEVKAVEGGDGEKEVAREGGSSKGDGDRRESAAEATRKEEARREVEFTSTLEYYLEHQAMQRRRELISKMNESMRSLLF